MENRYQADADELFGRLAKLVVPPCGFATIPFLAERPIPPQWLRIGAIVGLAYVVGALWLAINEFRLHRDKACRSLVAQRDSPGGTMQYGIRRSLVLRVIAQYKGITLALPLLAMYFAAVIEDPAGLGAAADAPLWVAKMVAHYCFALTFWWGTVFSDCNVYSWNIHAIVHRIGQVTERSRFDKSAVRIPAWLVRVEAFVMCGCMFAALFSARHPADVFVIAIAIAHANVIFFIISHRFLLNVYLKRAYNPSVT